MSKLKNDKYYTPVELAKYCVDKTNEIIGKDNITEYIEPSAGAGVFLDFLDKPYLAYDIEPEDDRITKANWLTVNLSYKKGRCIIGNPPFGTSNNLIKSFYNKAVLLSDYISFILPISQINNTQYLYKFDLVYSEDLGEQIYSDRSLHCCFNIYKRPCSNKLNSKTNYKLKDILISEYYRGQPSSESIPNDYDYVMGSFGQGCVGKEVHKKNTYAAELYFYITNDDIKDKVLKILKYTDWKSISKRTSKNYRLAKWQIYKYLKEQIPELEYEEDINKKNKQLF